VPRRKPSNEVDLLVAPERRSHGSRLRLDVDDLVFVDAAGPRVLVGVRRTAGVTGRVVLGHPTSIVQRVIALTGIDGFDDFELCVEASPA
jgi:anti-anti-sigma factor